MRLIKLHGRGAALAILTSLLLAAAAVASALYVDNLKSVRIAERMMHDAALLRVNESSIADVRAFAAHYSGTTTGKWPANPCVEADCLAVTEVPSEAFWQRHPKLSEWRNKVFRRNWSYSVFVWVERGKVVAQQQWFVYATPHRNLAVITQTSDPSAKLCQNESYRLHRAFATNFSPHHFNVWVDPKATASAELVTLNFSCAGNFSGCAAVSDVVPNAWKYYEADQQLLKTGAAEFHSTYCR